jgi:hypothetical protein
MAAVAALSAPASAHASSAGIAVIRSSEWSPGDTVRAGAGEFEVYVSVARKQRAFRSVGVVGIGNRHGLFSSGGEQALRFFALRGVPVAKLAQGGDLAADPDGLFLDGSNLTEAETSAVLAHCLDTYGPPPMAANPERPTASELEAIRAHLVPFRRAFFLATADRLASQ